MSEKQETPRDLVVAHPDSRLLMERGATSLIARGVELAVQLREDANTITLPDGVPLEMVFIPAGSFIMGSNEDKRGREQPIHTVTIAKPFLIGKYPVTQGQWQAVMDANPSEFTTMNKWRADLNRPVESVSWNDCQEFISRLNALGKGTFRLPSEAEWEYACRAGSKTRWCFGDDEAQLVNYAWYHYCPAISPIIPIG